MSSLDSVDILCKYVLEHVRDVRHEVKEVTLDISSLALDKFLIKEYAPQFLNEILLQNGICLSSLEITKAESISVTVFKKYTVKQTVDLITQFELSAGESFTDYFMHDNVYEGSWAFWLLGKGFIKKGSELVFKITMEQSYFDQEELFDVFELDLQPNLSERELDKLYFKNKELWAEFLTSNSKYHLLLIDFFKEHNL